MGQSESVREVNPPNGDAHGAKAAKFTDTGSRTVLGKYSMDMSKDGLMGEGSFSTCRKGKNNTTGEVVAIKFFKEKMDATQLFKFERQINVLNDLQTPFVKPNDPRLWSPELEKANPENLFMRLIDYSQNASGGPGADARDGVPYVITEIAQYSLLDYLHQRKKDREPLSKETVKSITKAFLLVIAGLHAKGMVHLDLKPENLMVFDGCLKLIDVDGCVKIGSTISISDPSISFSPCYCAPEWASFLTDASHAPTILASGGLDVWSVGCTICELVTLEAVMKPMYANFLRRAHSHREASFLFFDWLSSLRTSPTPTALERFDKQLVKLVAGSLLEPSKDKRKTCAEALSDPYLRGAALHRSDTNPLTHTADSPHSMPAQSTRVIRHRVEDHSRAVLFTGSLWKLSTGKDPMDITQWLQRDMWISSNHSLCYYSQADNKRLVLLDSHHLHGAEVTKVAKSARKNALQIKTCHIECPGDEPQVFVFAGSSPEDMKKWVYFLNIAATVDVIPTMKLGPDVAQALTEYKLSVKNRRMKVEKGFEKSFEPVFKGTLWKVKAGGDRMVKGDWFKRDMWIAHNGSLVYWSEKDQRQLIYYTSTDIGRATYAKIPDSKSLKPNAFQVILPPNNDLEFAPGEFAVESESMRDLWLEEFGKASRNCDDDNVDCFQALTCCT